MTETNEPTTPPPERRTWRERLHYWPNVLTFVVLLAVMLVGYRAAEERRAYVECHTEAMDTLHHGLHTTLAESPEDPAVWGASWSAAFALWEDEIKGCPSVEDLPGEIP